VRERAKNNLFYLDGSLIRRGVVLMMCTAFIDKDFEG
jgi:hypothetical protein